MTTDAKKIEDKLRRLGLSHEVVEAAWPTWWSVEAERSPAALNDLKFSLSRKLGIAPTSLFDEGDAVFVWHGEAKFKGLTTQSDKEKQALTSFGVSVAKLLLACVKPPPEHSLEGSSPVALRSAILEAGSPGIGIRHLLRLAQSLGIPVVYLRIFPLEAKRMTAMTVRVGDRFAVLLGKDSMYAAPVTFYVAHELGHIANAHLAADMALIDSDIEKRSVDAEEQEADEFALALLTGRKSLALDPTRPPRNAAELARAVCKAGKLEKIDPGVLALCYGYAYDQWQLATAALKVIYGKGTPAWREVNKAALEHLDLDKLTSDHQEYLNSVMGLSQDV